MSRGDPIVSTTAGALRGAWLDDGAVVFRGIRYGAPTGGANRFRPPQPVSPWDGIRDALSFGGVAPQTDPDDLVLKNGYPAPGAALMHVNGDHDCIGAESEDCLFLNVWSASLDEAAQRPVMVWLHGGGFAVGAGSEPIYDGANLARRHGVVVVTVNHRLGALGYAHLAGIGGEEFAHSGNAGTLDQVAALRWVRDNIRAFGGDPGRVMIFGQSGGGWKVCTLLGTAPAHGLFTRAAIQSGPALRLLTRERADLMARALLHELGLGSSDIDELRRLPAQSIVRAQRAVERRVGAPGSTNPDASLVAYLPNFLPAFAPVVDGDVVPAHPFHPAASPLSRDVAVMVGFTRTEMTTYADEATLDLDEDGLEARVHAWVGHDDAPRLLELYRRLDPDASAARRWARFQADLIMLPFAPVIAERHAELGGASSYLYRIDWETDVLGGRLMSPHAVEIALVFDNARECHGLCGQGATVPAMAERMSAAWAAFAATGAPDAPDIPHWPPYDAGRRATMLFGEPSRIADDPWHAEAAEATALMPGFEQRFEQRLEALAGAVV